MNPAFLPLPLPPPDTKPRRKEKPSVPNWPELVQRRLQISQALRAQIAPISRQLQLLTPEQRGAVFVKLETERPLTPQDMSGTGLKIFAMPAQNEILVVPRDETLDRFENVVRKFGEDELKPRALPASAKLVGSLHGITFGDPKDRLSLALRRKYSALVRRKSVTIEIEIVTFATGSKIQRKELETKIEDLRRALGRGVHGDIYDVDYGETGARACIWLTGSMLKTLVEEAVWQQVISLFEERPEFETFHTTLANFSVGKLGPILPPPRDAPTICIVDTGVSPGNPFLAPVVKKELCRSYVMGETDNPWDQNGHGSGVASLAAYYNLSLAKGSTHEAKAWIASAKILNRNGRMDEVVDEDPQKDRDREARLLSTILKKIVEDFRPHGVRIFVLSFSILNRVWNKDGQTIIPRASWLARAIDTICKSHDVVFVTITGNLDRNFVRDLHGVSPYPGYFSNDEVKVLDPGHAALALTVGSVAASARVSAQGGVPLALPGQPSPFTRMGPGLGGAIKPDFVERGGNFTYESGLRRVSTNAQTDVVMASNMASPAVAWDSGTSFAAPRIAHQLAIIVHDLGHAGIHSPSAPLMKALLANATTRDTLHDVDWYEREFPKKEWLNAIGMGVPNGAAALNCEEHSPLLYFSGEMLPDQVAFFGIPMPEEFAQTRSEKRISISVSYSPPVQQYGLQSYLGVTLKFRLFSGDKEIETIQQAMALDDGEANEYRDAVDDLDGGAIGVRRRSRGCIQHEVLHISQYPNEWTAHPFTLAVSLNERWGGSRKPVPIAVVVRIQDMKRTTSQVYTFIARALVQARARARR